MQAPILFASLARESVERALREDIGARDLSTEAMLRFAGSSPPERLDAVIRFKSPGVVCGQEIARLTFNTLDAGVEVDAQVADGTAVDAGAVVTHVRGQPAAILAGERVALNFMAHLSGIAATTRGFVEALAGTRCRVLDTRKTLPGLRDLQRYAVRCGGGINHRSSLQDAVLLKENHLALAGGVAAAVGAARAAIGPGARIEVEIETLEQLDEALQLGIEAVLLDNMSAAQVAEAVGRVRAKQAQSAGRPLIVEVSGNMTLDGARAAAAAGVDYVSVGALTHSAPAADVSLVLAPW
ncbi:MAG: carboxylating nicotinate-nucleotide diphosphorylase [Candidatus Schekmanbacteria bacterium]|nr:carboxylating nicotinate-nucleotide diphosphorylase [Candidatus Schekmanbacteria bacterium]